MGGMSPRDDSLSQPAADSSLNSLSQPAAASSLGEGAWTGALTGAWTGALWFYAFPKASLFEGGGPRSGSEGVRD